MSIELSAANERLLDDILADVSDPGTRSQLELKFRRKLKAKEDRAKANQEIFNTAFERAVSLGIDDPQDYADSAVDLAFMERIHAMKVAVIRKAPVRMATNQANRTAEADEALSKSANPSQRRSLQNDRKYLALVGSEDRAGRLVPGGLVGAKIQKLVPGYKLPHWQKTTLPLQVMALSLETHKRGGRTINLRLSHERGLKALGSSRGPASFVQNQVREMFKRRFAADSPEFWFVIERDADDRFHLHGAYVDQAHIDCRFVDKALRDAGGWSAGSGSGLGQISKPLNDAVWWASYCVKRLNLTATMTDRKLLASSAEIRDSARGSWENTRAEHRRF